MPADLRSITDFEDLVAYLGSELDWPVEDYKLDQLTFEYDADELGLKDEEAEKLKDGTIRQLRPLPGGQPFGIFFVEFGQAKLPVVVLRRILNALVIKKRNSANPADRQRWDAADILFISAFGESDDREIAFAHFHKDPDTTELPILRVLGWDGSDTPLKTKHVAEVLKNRLHWPDNAADQDAWRKQWRGAFRHRLGHVIKTSSDLADALAGFARKIRDAATTIMAHESEAKGQLRKLHRAFQSALISDLTEADFADTYAQTVTYGLLTAAISRTEMSEGRNGTALTQEDITAMVPVTNPFLKEMLQEFLKVGGRKGGVDFDELGINEVVELLRGDETDLPAILRDFGNRKPGEDPVIHFYEHFLAAYNKKLRIQRGVFYTPQPVVSYIVRSVHELLQTEFGLEDGLASTITWGEMIEREKERGVGVSPASSSSPLKLPPLTDLPGEKSTISPDEPFVQILDPATGTATFPVEVIDVIFKHLKERWRLADSSTLPGGSPHFKSFSDYWNHYVPKHLLPRLHGYELMMAPYAIAHMKIGLKLAETGYQFGTEERARIYLTNALEPWAKQLPLIGYDALAHEAAAVNEIKRHKRFTVVIGNPPYSNYGQLNKIPLILSLLADYKLGLDEKKLNLDDDFIKFIRFSQLLLDTTGTGVFGMITNNSFVDGITHRQMRRSLMGSFNILHILNLHGSSKKKEKAPDGSEDENVFEIQQGVATTLAVASMSRQAAEVFVNDLWGNRTAKYAALDTMSVSGGKWSRPKLTAPYYFFADKNLDDGSEYNDFLGLKSIFVVSGNGVKTERDGVSIHFTKGEIEASVRDFQSLDDASLRRKYETGDDSRDWTIKKAKADVIEHKGQPLYRRSLYRPFDIRHTWYSGQTRGFIGTPAFPTMRHMRNGNVAMVTTRQTAEKFDLLCTDNLVGHKSVAGYDINTAFPLYVFEEALSFGTGDRQTGSHGIQRHPNFSGQFLKYLSAELQLPQEGEHGLPADLTPENIFHYIYAVFHSSGYRSRYAEFLKIDFPRLPLTGNLKLFRELSRLGGELVALHLLESLKLDTPVTEFIGSSKLVSKPGWIDGTVWLDSGGKKAATMPGTSGFCGVPENVWNFHIGGYQVCEKWLKDRKGRTLTDEDIAHYHKIVIALTETIRLMAEIDEVIETHGGWPGAFVTTTP